MKRTAAVFMIAMASLAAAATPSTAACGPSWAPVKFPAPHFGPPAVLFGIAASSDLNAFSVGRQNSLYPWAMRWDGSQWSSTKLPRPGEWGQGMLADVVTFAKRKTWAAGYYSTSNSSRAWIVKWGRRGWATQTLPLPAGGSMLQGIDGSGPTDVWAVGRKVSGGQEYALVFHFDGTGWQSVAVPDVPTLRFWKVSVVSSTDLWAVGYEGVQTRVLYHFDGTAWAKVSLPGAPSDVEAVAADDVWVVAEAWGTEGGVARTLHWNGTEWSIRDGQNPGTVASWFMAMVVHPVLGAFAVGGMSGAENKTLAERWDGASWSHTPTPDSPTAGGEFWDAAAAGGRVWAVGDNENQRGIMQSICPNT